MVCTMHLENHYDLILLDLMMPGMDGFAVLEKLKAIEATRYVPVLVITAQPGHRLRALRAGAKDFISKPIDLTEAKARIHNLLEVRLLYRQIELHNQLLERTVLERTAELRASEERFHRLTELSSDWYWEQDAGGGTPKCPAWPWKCSALVVSRARANPDAPSWKRTSPHDVRSSTWSTAGRAWTVRCSISRSVANPSSASPVATSATAESAWTSRSGTRITDAGQAAAQCTRWENLSIRSLVGVSGLSQPFLQIVDARRAPTARVGQAQDLECRRHFPGDLGSTDCPVGEGGAAQSASAAVVPRNALSVPVSTATQNSQAVYRIRSASEKSS